MGYIDLAREVENISHDLEKVQLLKKRLENQLSHKLVNNLSLVFALEHIPHKEQLKVVNFTLGKLEAEEDKLRNKLSKKLAEAEGDN